MFGRVTALVAVVGATATAVVGLGAFGVSGHTEALGATTGAGVPAVASATHPEALYSRAAPGVVDIDARGSKTTHAPHAADSGTGFILDKQGDILTAAHVVEHVNSITVQLQDGTRRSARLLGEDNATDVAVLKIDPSGLDLHRLPLGSSAKLVIGENLAAIGDPFGYDRSFSTGVVSGLDRTISAPNGFTVAHAVQTDAPLNPGNSGGPLLTSDGAVVGIVDQIATNGAAQNSGVGFGVPIDLVKSELSQLEAGQKVEHAYLGVLTSDATGGREGALIADVVGGGPAQRAGLKAGDLITAIDGKRITGGSDIVAATASHKPGDTLELTVERDGKTRTVTVTLGTQPNRAPNG